MVDISQREMGRVIYTDIILTRGDSCTIVLPILSIATNGTKTEYSPSGSDEFAVTVRKAFISNSTVTPEKVFDGTVTTSGGKLNWEISSTDSTINTGVYYWDAQITTDEGVFTPYRGELKIISESTV